MSEEIIILTPESETRDAVANVLGGDDAYQVSDCSSFEELEQQLGATSAALASIDVDPRPLELLPRLSSVIARHPDTRFVVLCNTVDNDVLFEAMQVGARHCLPKDTIAANLKNVVRRLTKDAAQVHGNPGRLITVLSASGGCGATTVSINLASEAALEHGGPALLVDFDTNYGSVATYLGLKGNFGVADILSHTGTPDAHLVQSTASVHDDDLHVLLSPASVDFSHPSPIYLDTFDQVFSACRSGYGCTVVDAPRVSMDIAAQLADASDMTLIAFELSVIQVRNTRAILDALNERGVSMSNVLPLANRYNKRRAMPTLRDATEALGGIEITTVANDYSAAIRAINFGRPLSKIAPRSLVRTDLQALVSRAFDSSAAMSSSRR